MSIAGFPVGQETNVAYPDFKGSLKLHSLTQMSFDIAEGPFAHKETVSIEVQRLGNGIFPLSWAEESGATVTNVQDFDRGVVHLITLWAEGQ
jgi:phenolic acid decarboxylase